MGLWNIGNELFAEAGWFMLGGKNRKEIKKNKEFQNKYSGKRNNEWANPTQAYR